VMPGAGPIIPPVQMTARSVPLRYRRGLRNTPPHSRTS